jgi:hypothetical protein
MASYRLTFLILPLAAASLALSACGGAGADNATAGSDRRAEFREAALKFAKCMREHGVDMPDPKFDGGRVELRIGGPGDPKANETTMRQAQEACRKYMESVKPPDISEQQKREFKDRALRFARCMREQGIDMPDPQFGENGGMTQRFEEGTGPEDPRFREAQEKCQKYQPKFRGELAR